MATLSNRIRAHTEKEDGAKILIVQGLRFPTQTSLSSSEACNETAIFTGNLMVELFAGKLLPYTGMSSLCTAFSQNINNDEKYVQYLYRTSGLV